MKNKLFAKTIAATMSVAMICGSISESVRYNPFIPNVKAAGSDTASDKNDNWHIGYRYRSKDVLYYKDDNVYNREPDFSLVIENTKSNDSSIEKTFKVEPYTKYRFSAMVSYSGYSDLENPNKKTGASIGIARSYSHSNYVNTDGWTKAEFEFETKGENEVTLCLRNGAYGGCCKGKAYFSNICLEQIETEKTNKWNILAVAFQQVDVKDLKGKENIIRKKDGVDTQCLTKDDIDLIGINLKKLKCELPEMSDGLWDIDSVDYCLVKSSDSQIADELKDLDTAAYKDEINFFEASDTAVLTDLRIRDDGVIQIDPHTNEIEAIIEPILKNKEYDHIIFFSPFRDWTGGVMGTGGTFYCDGTNFCQIPCKIPKDYELEKERSFSQSGYVHELLHGMETRSKSIDPEKTANLHDNAIYGYEKAGPNEWKEWYTAYMRSDLTGGRGIAPAVYLTERTKYINVVSDDMTVNEDDIKYKGAVFSGKPKTLYLAGEELDLSGAVISGTDLDKAIPIEKIDTLNTSDFDNKKPGVYTIYADLSSYKTGLKASLDVQVVNEGDLIYGDADCNGIVDMEDFVLLNKYLKGNEVDLSVLAKRNADVYNPGSGITEDDAEAISKFLSYGEKLPVTTTLKYGDVNCDNIVDTEDVTFLESYLNGGNVRISAQGRINADVYNLGSGITEDDLDTINNYISGKTNLPLMTELLYGDVNCDGAVDSKDPMLLQSYIDGDNVRISAQGRINADVYNPGSGITEDDVDTINKYISGKANLPLVTELLYGDVNCDGVVDMEDDVLLQSYIDGDNVRISAQGKINADVFNPRTEADIHNPYSYLDENDVINIREYISGNTVLPVETKKPGDVNCDGTVDTKDSALLRAYLKDKLTRISAQGILNANVYLTPDSDLSKGDAEYIDKYISGEVASLPAGVILGDVDASGKVDMDDYNMVHDHIVGSKTLSNKLEKVADVNGDGLIDSKDDEMILDHINGKKPLDEYLTTITTTANTTTTTKTSSTTATTVSKPSVTKEGDTNCDGKVDLADAILIMQSLANPNKYGIGGTADKPLTYQGKINGDVDKSTEGLTANDALRIQEYLLHKVKSLDPRE
ncbi:dockerin type I domain-containing protein [Ruminococcus flavefaciens]|uniref:Dockerin domain-containing protein n=1 Tax=Ruminococcus flavefaciens 007c TaxID=1341157 RepID=W7UVP3_RUMFL|nr:dockerin type I domain-containing protein [Ruminococcus flavefaciens]EWM52407.1 hypothetical protein RF007C_13740 [Ruminococcus flavefaciens 007c]